MSRAEEQEEEIVIVSLLGEEEQKKNRKRRRIWVHKICKKRMIYGEFNSLYPDLLDEAKIF
jgi:hypothetical protein